MNDDNMQSQYMCIINLALLWSEKKIKERIAERFLAFQTAFTILGCLSLKNFFTGGQLILHLPRWIRELPGFFILKEELSICFSYSIVKFFQGGQGCFDIDECTLSEGVSVNIYCRDQTEC